MIIGEWAILLHILFSHASLISSMTADILDMQFSCWLHLQISCTVKPVFKTTWEVWTVWELRTAASVSSSIQSIEKDPRNKTTSEFRTVFDSPFGVPYSQVSLYTTNNSNRPCLTQLCKAYCEASQHSVIPAVDHDYRWLCPWAQQGSPVCPHNGPSHCCQTGTPTTSHSAQQPL